MEYRHNKQNSFRLRGGIFNLTTMELYSTDMDKIDEQLAANIAISPKFFDKAPLVIDLEKTDGAAIDLKALKKNLEQHNLIPVAICSSDKNLQAAAHKAKLGVLTAIAKNRTENIDEQEETASKDEHETVTNITRQNSNLVIHKTVRSGQQIYARGGDLTVIASVSTGAEILADGNIHVYGALRGRAFAGANGDSNAMIFCHNLQAELLAIAGHYHLNEKIDPKYLNKRTAIHLKDERLLIDLLD